MGLIEVPAPDATQQARKRGNDQPVLPYVVSSDKRTIYNTTLILDHEGRVMTGPTSTGSLNVKTVEGSVTTASIWSTQSSVNPSEAVFLFLSHSGDDGAQNGPDPTNMNVSASVAVTSSFHYKCPAGKVAYLSRVNFMIQDATMSPIKFGGITKLANGCKVEVVDSDGAAVLLDFMNGRPLQQNADFVYIAGADVNFVDIAASDIMHVRWTINKAFAGKPMRLSEGQRLRWSIQDSLAALTEFRAMLQGWEVDSS